MLSSQPRKVPAGKRRQHGLNEVEQHEQHNHKPEYLDDHGRQRDAELPKDPEDQVADADEDAEIDQHDDEAGEHD